MIAVVGYHVHVPGFADGFVGVDVFLVITGYLMSRKVITDLILSRFSFHDFVSMRVRRIYPALVVMTVSSAVVGWFVTLPGEYLRHLRQACYALLFLSNFAFDNDNGYFAMAAHTKPLLHTWSLAVEWQFYLWMPLILWLIARSASNSKFKVDTAIRSFLVAAALSLAWCLWQRVRREIWTHRRLLATSGVVFSLLLGFTTIAFLNTGFPSRLPDYLLPAEIARKTGTPRDECFRNSNSVKKATETYCSFGSEEGPETPSAIVWGDSFANQYLDPISAAALADGIHGLIATQSGCAAFIDDPAKETGYQQPCRDFNRGTLDFVLGHQEPRIVVLGSNWGDALDVSALVDRLASPTNRCSEAVLRHFRLLHGDGVRQV